MPEASCTVALAVVDRGFVASQEGSSSHTSALTTLTRTTGAVSSGGNVVVVVVDVLRGGSSTASRAGWSSFRRSARSVVEVGVDVVGADEPGTRAVSGTFPGVVVALVAATCVAAGSSSWNMK